MNDWELLELTPGEATKDDVRSAYRRLSQTKHPDHGGDPEAWLEFQVAYQALLEQCDDRLTCRACDGTGRQSQLSGWTAISMECAECQGTGSR